MYAADSSKGFFITIRQESISHSISMKKVFLLKGRQFLAKGILLLTISYILSALRQVLVKTTFP